MKIQVKTTGLLYEYLPAHRRGNRVELEVNEQITPLDVMVQLNMPLEQRYLTSLNGELLPEVDRSSRRLVENDELAIMSPLSGG